VILSALANEDRKQRNHCKSVRCSMRRTAPMSWSSSKLDSHATLCCCIRRGRSGIRRCCPWWSKDILEGATWQGFHQKCCQAANASLTVQINSTNQLNELTTDLLAAKEECEALKETLQERGAGFLGGKSWCASKQVSKIQKQTNK